MISSFRREVDENCTLLGHYTASSGNSLLMCCDNLSVPSSRVKNSSILDSEDGTNRLFRNIGKKLPLLAALWPRRGQFSGSGTVYRKSKHFSYVCLAVSLSLSLARSLSLSLSLSLFVSRGNINGGQHSPGLSSPANEY